MSLLRHFAVSRVHDAVTIAEYTVPDSEQSEKHPFEESVKRVMDQKDVIKTRIELQVPDPYVGGVHFESDGSYVFMVITSPQYPRTAAKRLLRKAREQFEGEFGGGMSTTEELGLTKQGRPIFKGLVLEFADITKVEKIAAVTLQVEQVKTVMASNIQAALKNGENLETLLDDSNDMRNQATTFHRSTNQVRSRMRWKNIKMTIVFVVVLLALVLVIALPIVLKNSNKTPA